MDNLPNRDVWFESDTDCIRIHLRAWRTALRCLVGTENDHSNKISQFELLSRAERLLLNIDELERDISKGLSHVCPSIPEDLAWILNHTSSYIRSLLISLYSKQIVDLEYESMLDEFKRMKDIRGPDSPEVQSMRALLIAKGDQLDALSRDYLLILLQQNPGGKSRIPPDVRDILGIEDESNNESDQYD